LFVSVSAKFASAFALYTAATCECAGW